MKYLKLFENFTNTLDAERKFHDDTNSGDRKRELIAFIDNQESKMDNPDWFKDDKDGSRRKKMQDNIDDMYDELYTLQGKPKRERKK